MPFTNNRLNPSDGILTSKAIPWISFRSLEYKSFTMTLWPFFSIKAIKVCGSVMLLKSGIFLCSVDISAHSPCLDIKNHFSGLFALAEDIKTVDINRCKMNMIYENFIRVTEDTVGVLALPYSFDRISFLKNTICSIVVCHW